MGGLIAKRPPFGTHVCCLLLLCCITPKYDDVLLGRWLILSVGTVNTPFVSVSCDLRVTFVAVFRCLSLAFAHDRKIQIPKDLQLDRGIYDRSMLLRDALSITAVARSLTYLFRVHVCCLYWIECRVLGPC